MNEYQFPRTDPFVHVDLEKRGVAKTEAARIIRDYAPWPVVDNSLEILLTALDEQTRWRLSLWDALFERPARASGASEIYTEDFNHGQDYGGIRAINPFR